MASLTGDDWGGPETKWKGLFMFCFFEIGGPTSQKIHCHLRCRHEGGRLAGDEKRSNDVQLHGLPGDQQGEFRKRPPMAQKNGGWMVIWMVIFQISKPEMVRLNDELWDLTTKKRRS